MTRERPGFLLVHDCLSHKDFEAQSVYGGAECCGITSFCFGTLREKFRAGGCGSTGPRPDGQRLTLGGGEP